MIQFQPILPVKLTCPLKINGWFMYILPIEIVPLKRGRIRSFFGGVVETTFPSTNFWTRGKARARIFITSLGSDSNWIILVLLERFLFGQANVVVCSLYMFIRHQYL